MALGNRTKGFTVTELLVVVAVIGVLSAVVFASISQTRQNARNKQRTASLEQVELALEVYKQAYGSYPLSCGGSGTMGKSFGTGACPTNYIAGMSSIIGLPLDPVTSTTGGYRYISNGTSYRLEAYNSVENYTVKPTDTYAACASTCSGGVCGTSGGQYTNSATQKTYAVWKGATYQCSQ